MSEIEDLIGIYGAIDQAVDADSSLTEVVAPFLRPYENGAAGWFDEFTRWTADRLDREPNELFPTLEVALGHLGEPVETAPRGRMRARRLLVVAIAARVFPHVSSEGSDVDLVLGALSVAGLATEHREAELLHLLTKEPDIFAGLDDWSAMVQAASDGGLISEVTAKQVKEPPCAGRLVMVRLPGDPDPVPVIETQFCTTTGLSLADAKRFLEPSNWPQCSDFWCEMRRLTDSAAGNPRYHEVVSVNCDNRANVWTAEACLEFRMINLPNGALATYNLCEGHPKPGALILVDSGTLTVLQVGNEVCVYTTKRVLFDHPFSGPSLAMLTCALGYGAIAKDLVFNCALVGKDKAPGAGTDFPGTDLPVKPRPDPGDSPVAKKSKTNLRNPFGQGRDPAAQAAVKDVLDDGVGAAKQCIDDCADAYQTSYGKVRAGEYKADDLVNDMAQMWMRLLRDGATAVDLGMRATRAMAPRPTPGPRTASGADA